MTVKKKQAIHRHAGKQIVTLQEAAECPVRDPETRDGSTLWGKQKTQAKANITQIRRDDVGEKRDQRYDERTRREKARVPFPEPGSHKLPQCGRFQAIWEYSVWPIQFL